MSIHTIIKEISIVEQMMNLSVEIQCDHYRNGLRAPRIELVFENGTDDRRMVLHANSFTGDESEGTAVAYATYIYNLSNVFWDCIWQDCRFWLDVEYDGETYHKVPLDYQTCEAGRKGIVKLENDHIKLHFPESVDAVQKIELNPLTAVLAVLLHLGNAALGILLLPWFAVDVLGMLLLGTEQVTGHVEGSFIRRFIFYVSYRYFTFGRNKLGVAGMKINILQLSYQLFSSITRKKKGILYLSTRRNDLTGNFEYVNEYLKNDSAIGIRFWLHPEDIRIMSIGTVLDLAVKASRAKVILIDDYVPFLEKMGISRRTKVIQLWHACGAFKTFGFSRTGKKGGPTQNSPTHRGYSYTFVSSASIAKYYAEGFGISEKKVIPYGVPRTDIFFDEEIRSKKRETLFSQYPALKNKKVILFAPTFRGDGKHSAYYEKNRFDPNRLMDHVGEDYTLIIKHHPFVELKYKIEDRHRDKIFDFSKESEINDLLIITDLLITDYSSVIYEASLLNIPMLFYAYDLENYIATRDFYSGYEHFVPGKIVKNQEELTAAIVQEDYLKEKVEEFCHRNFDIRDGKASERIADYIRELLSR